METRPPLPPFTHESAKQKVRLAEDGLNTLDATNVVTAYTLEPKNPQSSLPYNSRM